MKTIQEIQKEIVDIEKFCATDRATKRQMASGAKRIENLRSCIMYLETNPSQEFMLKQLAQLKDKVSIINSGFSSWKSNNPKDAEVNNPKSKYETMMGLKTIKSQIKNLNYMIG